MRTDVFQRSDETLIVFAAARDDQKRVTQYDGLRSLGSIELDPAPLSPTVAEALAGGGCHVVAGADADYVRGVLYPRVEPPARPRIDPRMLIG